MKKLILFFTVSFFLISCEDFKPKVPEIIISGEIQNFSENKLILRQNKEEFEINLDKDGKFTDTIYDFEDGYFKLIIGKEYTQLFLKDGTDIFLTTDAENIDKSIKYSGIGANENNFLAQKTLQNKDFNYWNFSKNNEALFLTKVDSFITYKQQFLGSYNKTVLEFDKEFYNSEKNNNIYLGGYIKEMFQQTHSYYTENDNFKPSKTYYSFRKNIPLENKNALKTEYYPYYVESYINNNISENDTSENAFEALRIINRDFQDNDLKKEFIYQSAKRHMSSVVKLDEYWPLVSFMVTDKTKLKELKKEFKKVKKIQPNQNSPLTSFKDKDKKEYNLADFKGQFVYIDIWAQWCAPCKAEAPFLKLLEEKYAEQNILFLKISLDKDQDAWRKYIVENNITENSFILDNHFDSEFAESYLINSIPRFILLDKDLKIIDSDAKRPSNGALEAQLDKLLNV